MKRFGSIQMLRAAAALMVAAFHACQWAHIDFAVGAAGVDLFFVISGFVLWSACAARPTAPGAFLLARARRVIPLYWIATLAVYALALWRPQALPIVHPQVRHLVLSLLLLPHTDPDGGPFPLLPPGWTLIYEAFFYALFALALAAPKDRRFQVLALGLLIGSLIGFGYHGWYTLLANPLLMEFLGGVWLARLWGRGRLQCTPAWLGWGWIAAGVLALAALQISGVRDDFWRPLLWGPPALLIVAGALRLEAGERLGSSGPRRALEAVGDASYSLYLVQAPVIAAFAWATPRWPGPMQATLGLLLALGAGLACHRLVERPLLRLFSGRDRSTAPGPGAGETATPGSSRPGARPAGARS